MQPNCLKAIRLIEGFREFHYMISSKKLISGVAINCANSFVKNADKEVGLSDFFGKHLYSIDHVNYRSKPDPAIYRFVAERLEVDPAHCIAIEDSGPGVAAAKNAGMCCIGINTARNRKNLEQADYIVDTYKQIDLELFSKQRVEY